MNSKKKYFMFLLVILLSVSSVFAFGKKDESGSSSSSSSVQNVRVTSPVQSYGSWVTIFENSNNSPTTDEFSRTVSVSDVSTVTASAGTSLSFVETQLGFENGRTVTEEKYYRADLPPYSLTIIKKRAIYSSYNVLVNGASVGSGKKVTGMNIDKSSYAL